MTAELARERADRAVVAALAARGISASRAAVQRWMAEGGVVTADGKPCAPASRLSAGMRLEVRPTAEPPTTATPDASVPFAVLYEDDQVLVIDKPAGVVVHPARGNWEGTLVHGLLAHTSFDADGLLDEGALGRPGIVHRLDKGTSGILVVAKTPPAREHLKAQFAAHTTEREYVALVVGEAQEARIEAMHGRHPRDRMRFTSTGRPVGARVAITHVKVLERLPGATLVACRLETGRTHQIRVHLSERSKTPILGDPVYGKRPKDDELAAIGDELGRQALHARLLGFSHPSDGRRIRFESEMPADMQRALAAIRARSG